MIDRTHNAKSKLFLLTSKLSAFPKGGREMLSKLNFEALCSKFGDRLIVFELPQNRMKKISDVLNAFRGHIDGLNRLIIDEAIKQIQREKVSKVFLDGSNLGGFVSELKRSLPDIEIITFYHNVEARFFWGNLRAKITLRAVVVFIVNYLAERRATCLSDKRICLSTRDSELLRSLYGFGATHIAPIAVSDRLVDQPRCSQIGPTEPFMLFVGGNFYANRKGITWFVKKVARRISMRVCIVGNGMEDLRSELEIPGRVEVIGSVDDLAEWYRRARFVIAPIFDGSGMKTKVAEAMMYGKKVVGTPEAFSGYEFAEDAGWVCRTANDFVLAINAAKGEISYPFDHNLRQIYLQHYSFEAAKERLSNILL